MYHPTTRVLAVLALLQAHGRMSGSELAQRLEVNIRTLRRYIIMLQDLGIPIEAERGRNGAYVLSAGFKLPPMMFTNEEALALTIGLISARRLHLADTDRAIESAFAKLERVMPLDLKSRVRALTETITLGLNTVSSTPPRKPRRAQSASNSSLKCWRKTKSFTKEKSRYENSRTNSGVFCYYAFAKFPSFTECFFNSALNSFGSRTIKSKENMDI